MKKILATLLSCSLMLTLASCGKEKELPATAYPISAVENQVGLISFIDLGMSEATLVQAGTTTILIDTGSSGSYSQLREYLKGQKISAIDCLIITNPKEEYCGAAAELLDDYKVRQILVPKWSSDVINKYQHYIDFNTKMIKEGIQVKNTNYGFKGTAGQIKILCLGPQNTVYADVEDHTQIIRLSMGGVTYLHMGAAGTTAEQELVSGRLVCQSDIVRTSRLSVKGTNSQEFLETVNPTIAIAPGSGKGFKNARSEIIDQYEKHTVELFEMSDHGTVVLATDGRTFGLTSDYYKNQDAGEKLR